MRENICESYIWQKLCNQNIYNFTTQQMGKGIEEILPSQNTQLAIEHMKIYSTLLFI